MSEELQPPQTQARQPGREHEMEPRPDYAPRYPGVGKLEGRVALITGGDSGIGRAVAVAMAREGARIAVAGDIGDEACCRAMVEKTVEEFGQLDILVNNAAEQHEVEKLEDLSAAQLERTFRTNVFGYFYMTKAALPHLGSGATIINTTSITAYQGHMTLLDYTATRGAIVSYTRALSQALSERGIRVNAVAAGPIWTPLIPASFEAEHVAKHGGSTPMNRAGQPNEVAPCYVFLASEDASYMSGQVLHPNGDVIVGS